ncbi:MAG: hypothetical protein KUG78_00600 [Kangiellaceae bacterium]|nr:hypothetical protein [Kangiellaceae bacterium]
MNVNSAIGFILISLCIIQPAIANKPKKFKVEALSGFTQAPKITVYSSNGEKYTHIDKTKISKVKVGIGIECKWEGKGNKAYDGDLRVPGYTSVGNNSPSDKLIPHSNTASREFRFDNGKGQTNNPLKICNEEVQKKLSKNANKNKYHVLAEGFTVNYPAALNIEYKLQCNATAGGKSSYDIKRRLVNAKIDCQSSDLAKKQINKVKVKKAVLLPMVSKVSFNANPEVQVGNCPTHIDFVGSITATRKGKVKYRYIKNNGKKSPVFTINFTKAGTKKTSKWDLTASKPKVAKRLKAGPSRQSRYEIQGYYRLVIESPKSKLQAKATYKVDCNKPNAAKRHGN